MTLSPILMAPTAVQLHLVFALLALVLTPIMLWRRKGDKLHRRLGQAWVLAMAATALSSFAITEIRLIGLYSPIHILSVITLVSLFQAVRYARAGNIRAHKRSIFAAAAGLMGAGGFTLLPGRLLSQSLFEGAPIVGFVCVVTPAIIAAVILTLQARKAAA